MSATDPEAATSRYFVARDNLRLHYLDVGPDPAKSTATAVLCLPGLTRNGRDFFPLAARLAHRRRVLILDGRGRGRSDYATDPRQYRGDADLDDVLQFLVASDAERVVAIGTSFGGMLALALAVFRPTVLAGLVLNDIGPAVGWEAVDRLLKAFAGDQPLTDWDEAVGELKRLIPELGFGDDEQWRHAAKATWRRSPDGRLRMDVDSRLVDAWRKRGVGDYDLWALWRAASPIPTLLLRGEISQVLTMDTVERMKAHKPDLRFATVPGVGHAPSLVEPDARVAIEALLADIDAVELGRERSVA
jgi:pimeloyl-ACP methyl ester carboxylesterase